MELIHYGEEVAGFGRLSGVWPGRSWSNEAINGGSFSRREHRLCSKVRCGFKGGSFRSSSFGCVSRLE